LLPADHLAGLRTGIRGIDAFPSGAAEVIFSLHIFEVQRKTENVFVLHLVLGISARNSRKACRRGQRCAEPGLQRAPA
jgi:hypothetical protein